MRTAFYVMMILASTSSLAFAQYQGVAASDSDNYVAVSNERSAAAAERVARDDCYNSTGHACKAISARENNSFVVVSCRGGVHMAADSTTSEALRVARANASSFGHGNCRVIYSD